MPPKLRGRAAAEAAAAEAAAALAAGGAPPAAAGAGGGGHGGADDVDLADAVRAVQGALHLNRDAHAPPPIPAHIRNAPKGDNKTHLKHFNVIARNKGVLGIVPQPGAPPGRIFLKDVREGSWAEAMGLEPYDELLELNGIPCFDMSKEMFDIEMKDKRPLDILVGRVELRPRKDAADRDHQLIVPPLVRNKHAQSTFTVTATDRGRLGMVPSGNPPGRVFIKFVDKDEWADEVGMQADDEILKVDNLDVEVLDEEEFREILLNVRPLRFLLGRQGLVPKAGAKPAAVTAPNGGYTVPVRSRQYQTIFTVTAPPDEYGLGLIPHKLPPNRMFIKDVAVGDWSESVDIQVNDELLKVEGIDVLQLDEARFRIFMSDVRPLRLTFGRLGLVKEQAGIEINKKVELPSGMVPEPPFQEGYIKHLADETQTRRREAERARIEFRRVAERVPPSLADRFQAIKTLWGDYQFSTGQPFGGAAHNIDAAKFALNQRPNLDDEVSGVLDDLWKAVNGLPPEELREPQEWEQEARHPAKPKGMAGVVAVARARPAEARGDVPTASSPAGGWPQYLGSSPGSPSSPSSPQAGYGGVQRFPFAAAAPAAPAQGRSQQQHEVEPAWSPVQGATWAQAAGNGHLPPRRPENWGHGVGAGRQPQQAELEPFLDELDRLEKLVHRWAETEGREQYSTSPARNQEAVGHALGQARALRGLRGATPEEAAPATGETPMTGSAVLAGGAVKPVSVGRSPTGMTFEQELQRLRQEVAAIRDKTRVDLGISNDRVMFV